MLSLSLGFTLIQTLNLVYYSLTQEIGSTNSERIANVFLYNVQKQEVTEVTKLAKTYAEYKVDFAPLVQARLTHINGKKITRVKDRKKLSLEERLRYRWLTREQRLSYKDTLNSSEKIIQGKFWKKGEKLVQISLAKRFSESAQIGLNDLLQFDIQGRSIQGRVTSIREIDWLTMKPNFFMILPVKAIQEAPQTLIASLKISDQKKILDFQTKLANKYPNISVINITKIVENVQTLLNYFLAALKIIAWFCVAVGIIILIGTFSVGHQERLDQVALMRTLGCDKKTIVAIDAMEFLSIGIVTSLICSLLSYSLAKAVTYQMDIPFQVYPWQIFEFLFIICLPLFVGTLVNWRTYSSGVMANLRKEI